MCAKSPWARSPSRITGGVVKVWWGAGDGTVHSRPLAPSQARASARAPLRLDCHRMKNMKNGVTNMPKAPIELTRFQRSEEHTSELQSLMRISYAVFCLKKKKISIIIPITNTLTHIQNQTTPT